LPETFLILRRIQQDIIVNLQSLPIKRPSFLSDFNEILTFWADFLIIQKYQFHENPSSGTKRHMRMDGRTDRQTDREKERKTDVKELFVAFRNFPNAPKTCFFNVTIVPVTCTVSLLDTVKHSSEPA
jgi:hypothetical protein